MRSLSFIVSILLIIVNVLAGLIITTYFLENVIMSSCVLFINAMLLWIVGNSNMKDAFKVSFYILFSLLCLIEFILAVLAPAKWVNNLYLVAIIVCFAIQAILVFAAIKTTQHNQQKYDRM